MSDRYILQPPVVDKGNWRLAYRYDGQIKTVGGENPVVPIIIHAAPSVGDDILLCLRGLRPRDDRLIPLRIEACSLDEEIGWNIEINWRARDSRFAIADIRKALRR